MIVGILHSACMMQLQESISHDKNRCNGEEGRGTTWHQPGLSFVNETSLSFTGQAETKASYRGRLPLPKKRQVCIKLNYLNKFKV